ncbi:MAG TPA: hypothetical protein PK668_08320 [Myxococcota bacterium]|nr:hypothetical protein [Myxococcota bacterium]HRY93019.1 hypothetical protein [Myxococcota bacterium]HSA20248.1 hypothetical protein [Myxococcota bacterium]
MRLVAQVTPRCQIGCAHCAFEAGPASAGLLAPATLAAWLDRLRAAGCAPTHLGLTGGDAMLAPRRVQALARLARARGLVVRLVTSARFARDGATTARATAALVRAGITGLWVGHDAFHLRAVPEARVVRLLRAGRAAGLAVHLAFTYVHPRAVGLRGKGLPGLDARLEADRSTHARQRELSGLCAELGASHGWSRLVDAGRARALLAALPPALAGEIRADLAAARGQGGEGAMLGLRWDGRPLDEPV